jgi:hypothetical protein
MDVLEKDEQRVSFRIKIMSTVLDVLILVVLAMETVIEEIG